MDCPCGTGRSFDACCGPLLDRGATAPTAEALMRSRFTAFSIGDADYLAFSWADGARPGDIVIDPDRRWTTLEIVATERGQQLDAVGLVEFRAHWEDPGAAGVLHKRSRFARTAGRWVYVDDETR